MEEKVLNLRLFNTENCSNIRRDIPSIRFSDKGSISLNKELCELVKLLPSTRIEFVQDKEKEKDWYFYKTESKKGFLLRNRQDRGVVFSAKELCRLFFESTELVCEKSLSFIVGSHPTKLENEKLLYSILINSVKK